jgi:hypothetical protein
LHLDRITLMLLLLLVSCISRCFELTLNGFIAITPDNARLKTRPTVCDASEQFDECKSN